MNEQEIINSEAFRAINLLIDQKADELESWMYNLKERVDQSYLTKGHLGTRVFTENKGVGHKVLPAEIHSIKGLLVLIDYIKKCEETVSELQRLKLHLLNDYDFTQGDNTEQKKVFGDGETVHK